MSDAHVDAFIAVGSNIEPERNVARALQFLQQQVRVAASSTFYWTTPVGRLDQPRFLNGVWRVETCLSPSSLKFDVLRDIESKLGRVRTMDKYAPRTIDLDVLLHGRVVLSDPDLQIPDPDIRERPFIVVPLLELAPDLTMPDTGEPIAALVDNRTWARLEPAEAVTERLRQTLARPRTLSSEP
ncbi:MAG: 2-amino-4-hydroxy-6-hydroxymethyldihydropteridine diphosphokinase [Planctomycetes bacterium]|nr:2-amino-4-hydroxy-6-hydroxymethyldihydropteridine diphosphokinase [Planctomycetota bacterium]